MPTLAQPFKQNRASVFTDARLLLTALMLEVHTHADLLSSFRSLFLGGWAQAKALSRRQGVASWLTFFAPDCCTSAAWGCPDRIELPFHLLSNLRDPAIGNDDNDLVAGSGVRADNISAFFHMAFAFDVSKFHVPCSLRFHSGFDQKDVFPGLLSCCRLEAKHCCCAEKKDGKEDVFHVKYGFWIEKII
jgi:hypothetical protein